MTFAHTNDIIFNILYGSDIRLVQDLLQQMIVHHDLLWQPRDWDLLKCKAVFFLLLQIDSDMKELVCTGKFGMAPMPESKAVGFFTALHDEAIQPFLKNSTISMEDLITSIKNLYLVA